MNCLHPILVRDWSQRCINPNEPFEDKRNYISYRTNSYSYKPCGKCVACLSRRRNDWTYRLTKEKEMSDYTYFLTLTYDQANIPIRIVDNTPYFVFDKTHVQKYLKRVRYFMNDK